jgi:hypothetical protein
MVQVLIQVVGGSALTTTNSTFDKVLTAIYTDEASVNNVVSLYITEYFGYPADYNSTDDTLTFDLLHLRLQTLEVRTHLCKNFPEYLKLTKSFGDKYAGFTDVTESKLLMHPYTVTILDDLRGNRQEIKNEYVTTSDLTVNIRGSLGNIQ